MNVLIIGDAPWSPTGYGKVTKHLINAFENVSVWTNKHQGNPINHHGTKIYPKLESNHGYDALPKLLEIEKPDAVITLRDIGLQKQYGDVLKNYIDVKWIPYIPLDSTNTFNMMKTSLKHASEIITMSKYGKKKLEEELNLKTTYIPHGVNTKLYTPLETSSALDDKFVVFTVGVNQTRKMWGRLLQGFSLFAENKNDVVYLIHSDKTRRSADAGGYNLPLIIKQLGINALFTTDQKCKNWRNYITEEQMVKLYNTADVGLYAGNEGFGLPVLEQQACGKPIVIGNQTSAKELVNNHGKLVKINGEVMMNTGIKFSTPSSKGIKNALNEYYYDYELREEHGLMSRNHALKYSWRKVLPKWQEAIK